MTTVKAEAGLAAQPIREDIQYGPLSVIGNGSFGVVFKTTIADSKGRQNVALKKVLQDRRYKVSRYQPTGRAVLVSTRSKAVCHDGTDRGEFATTPGG